jgi:hypothetical protein
MVEQYKKTFVPLQLGIWLVAGLVTLVTRSVHSGAVFLATMQLGALFGAIWGARLKATAGRT